MKSFDTDLKKYAEKIHLKVSERRELRERILSYMEYHPLPKREESISYTTATSEQYFIWSPFSTLWGRVAAATFAFLVIIGVPIAAERSVPGDVLYIVKTEVNESIQSQFANSPYEKVVFETRLMERRIGEARLLASEGKLTEEVEAAIAETVKVHADAAQNGLALLRTDNAEEAAIAEITFGSALEVQSAVLDTNKSAGATSSIENILGVVNTTREEVEHNRGTSTPSYAGLSARIELETTRAYELFETVKVSATKNEVEDITRRLADINRQIEGAKKIQSENEEMAITELREALGLTQKLIVFMTDIDIRENVMLETLVPIVPTLEERTTEAQATFTRIETIATYVREQAPSVTAPDAIEKITLGIEQVDGLMGAASTSLQNGTIDVAENVLKEAEAIVLDLENMIKTILEGEETKPINEVIEAPVETGTSTESLPKEINQRTDVLPEGIL